MSTPTPRKRRQPKDSAPPSPSSAQNGRVFADSDEIRLLKTLQKLNKEIPPSSSSITTTLTVDSPSFKRVNSALNSKYTHGQITDKLRRLRIKYHKLARSKSLIKTPHDQDFFQIAQNIWGKKTKAKKVENCAATVREEDNEHDEQQREEVDLEEYPILVNEFSKFLPLNLVWREALKSLGNGKLKEMNDKWTMIGIEEAKIVTKKAELVKEQTNLVMQVLGHNSANEN